MDGKQIKKCDLNKEKNGLRSRIGEEDGTEYKRQGRIVVEIRDRVEK